MVLQALGQILSDEFMVARPKQKGHLLKKRKLRCKLVICPFATTKWQIQVKDLNLALPSSALSPTARWLPIAFLNHEDSPECASSGTVHGLRVYQSNENCKHRLPLLPSPKCSNHFMMCQTWNHPLRSLIHQKQNKIATGQSIYMDWKHH